MTSFWSGWVIVLVVLNLSIVILLFIWALGMKIPTQSDGTTGHVWAHGVLRESVHKLPLWWVVLSVFALGWGIVYLAFYPGFGNFRGALGWTSSAEHERLTAANDARLATVFERLQPMALEQLALDQSVRAIGGTLFQDNCAACHGIDARGNRVVGAPDLTDQDWQYGGSSAEILTSILDGRTGAMPALGAALGREGINEVAAYVVSLAGRQAPADWVTAGKARFETLCAACHGIDGRGNPVLGASNLTDDVWLYGGDFASIVATIRDGRTGVMPAWRERLGKEQVRLVAAWVMAQGGAPVGH